MRWRVGRSLTWRSRARTSCHGQPLRSSDPGSIGWPSADTLLTTVTGRDSITRLFLIALSEIVSSAIISPYAPCCKHVDGAALLGREAPGRGVRRWVPASDRRALPAQWRVLGRGPI